MTEPNCNHQTTLDLLTTKDRDLVSHINIDDIIAHCGDCKEFVVLSSQYFQDDELYTAVEFDEQGKLMYSEYYIYRKWD